MKTYTINVAFLEKLTAKLANFNKKFAKYGNGSVTFEVSEPYAIKSSKTSTMIEVVDVTVEGSYKVCDYEFVACLDWDIETKQNIIKTASIDVKVPVEYRTRNYCDHCNTTRNRKSTVLLRNVESGEYRQVGKGCVKDYLGRDIADYASYLSLFDNLDEFIKEDSFTSEKPLFKVRDILLQVIEDVKRFGYISKAKSWDNNCLSSAQRCYAAFNRTRDEDGLICEIYDVTEESMAKYLDVEEFVNNLSNEDDYIHNIQILINKHYVDFSNMGLVVSIYGYFLRETAKREELKKTEENPSKYIGNVGDKVSFTAVPECVYSMDTEYGMYYIYKFTTSEGNVVIWKTSKFLEDNEITLKGTVKTTEIYKGVKQTEVTRCRVA